MILLFGLELAVLTDSYINKLHKIILQLIILFAATLIVQNIADAMLAHSPNVLLHLLIGIYGYSARPALVVLFFYFIDNGKRIFLPWCLAVANALLYLTALFSPATFSYRGDDYSFFRGPMGLACHVVSALLLLALLVLVIYEYRDRKKEMIYPFVCVSFITVGVLTDYFLPVDEYTPLSALTIAVVISCVFVYFWLHTQFVRQHESDLMAQQRIKIMVSQIQPHFLFNTIATFRALCKSDPDKAANVAEKFGLYLRQNLDSLESENVIPIDEELEHTKVYADIEMVRFENIRVEYQIADRDFYLPPLTVQPMVENAIRHGVRIRQEGIVRVITRRTYHNHEIIISDNGAGFDPMKLATMSGSHIGIANVRERIEKFCGGTLTLESTPDVGTTVTIRIPDQEASE